MATGRVPTTANSPLTAKGDLFGYSTTQARVPVGSDGETIVADSSTATGLKWAAPSSGSSYVAGKNFVINGGFDIWQRGTSFASAANIYTTDRWLIYRSGANLTTSRVATGDTTNLPNIQYATRLQRTASSTNLDVVYFMNMFETVNTIPLVGQTVTLSFYARRGANYSPTSNILNASVRTGTGTDQNWISGYTGEATPLTTNATLTTTWQRFTVSGTIATTANELTVLFSYTPTGTAGAADLVEITGVQLEVSASATAFSRACGTIQGELAACQRYYWRGSGSQGINAVLGSAQASSTTAARGYITFPVTMRTAPSAVDWSSLSINEINAGYTISAVTLVGSGVENANMGAIAITTTGLNQYRYYVILINNSSSGFLGFSAEL
jgi:hypothetical protein